MPKWKFAAVLLALAGCVETAPGPGQTTATVGSECGGPAQPTCQFFFGPYLLTNRPVKVAQRKADFYPLARRLGFVDSSNSRWVAPSGTLTDGASIPPIFIAVIGNPRSKEFSNAAALHDAYCGIGNEDLAEYHSRDWREVHRMFHDGLRVGGTDEIRAKIMFAAVWLGGPRWGDIGRDLSADAVGRKRRAMSFAQEGGAASGAPDLEGALRQRLRPSGQVAASRDGLAFQRGPLGQITYAPDERDFSGIPEVKAQQIMRETQRYIQTTKPTPSLDQIIAFIERREDLMLRRYLASFASGGDDESMPVYPIDEEDEGIYDEEDEYKGDSTDTDL